MSNKVICQYIPHGAIPDKRGFAPAIVAENISKHFQDLEPFFICSQEDYANNYEENKIGKIYRINESALYKRLFKKITKLDPYPLHMRSAKIINESQHCDYFCSHQLEFNIKEFKNKLDTDIKTLVYAHALRTFNPQLGIADRYIAVSQYTKNMLVETFNYPQKLVEVIYNGVDTNLFNSTNFEVNQFKNKYKIPQNSIVITYIGRKQESKGFYNSLKTMEYITTKYKNNIFCITVGSTPKDAVKDKHFNEEQQLLKKLKQKKNFLDLPALKHSELRKIYALSDIQLFPSYFKGEQHPLVAVESLASKTIFVTSAIASIPEFIEDKINGILLNNPKDDNELMETTDEIIKNIEKYEYLKENGRKTAIKKFDWRIIAKKFEDVCKGL